MSMGASCKLCATCASALKRSAAVFLFLIGFPEHAHTREVLFVCIFLCSSSSTKRNMKKAAAAKKGGGVNQKDAAQKGATSCLISVCVFLLLNDSIALTLICQVCLPMRC